MPRNPKLFISDTLIEISSRIQEGLPFVPNKLTYFIIGNILARAQTLYPATIVAYSFMQNHFHLILVVQDPQNVPDFIEYLKRESAHALNRLLGRRQHTVWCQGFDNPIILDSETAINRLSYLYLNPVAAGLVPTAEEWRLSSASWVDFSKEISEIHFKPIPRNKIPRLPERPLSLPEINNICNDLKDLPGEDYTLRVEPHAWKECFSDTKGRISSELHKLIFARIRNEEQRLQKEKEEAGSTYPNKTMLETQDVRRPHTPEKFGIRNICLGNERRIRATFIRWIKDMQKELPRFLKQKGIDYQKTLHYPPGFFAPGGFLSASILPMFTPIPFIT